MEDLKKKLFFSSLTNGVKVDFLLYIYISVEMLLYGANHNYFIIL